VRCSSVGWLFLSAGCARMPRSTISGSGCCGRLQQNQCSRVMIVTRWAPGRARRWAVCTQQHLEEDAQCTCSSGRCPANQLSFR
jgi:hypothetical protein